MMMNDVPMDNLVLNFTVEDWLDSDTAELTVDVDASVEGNDGFQLRDEIKDSLVELVDADWRFVRVSRRTDKTGREAWSLAAQARVSEDEITNLGSRTKSLGRVGLQFRVANVDYSPTRETVEELNRSLRSQVNALVEKELEALNDEVPGRNWRVSSVVYSDNMSYSNFRGPMIMAAAAAPHNHTIGAPVGSYDDLEVETGPSQGFGGFEVSQKVTFNANVTVSSTVDGFDSVV